MPRKSRREMLEEKQNELTKVYDGTCSIARRLAKDEPDLFGHLYVPPKGRPPFALTELDRVKATRLKVGEKIHRLNQKMMQEKGRKRFELEQALERAKVRHGELKRREKTLKYYERRKQKATGQ